MSRLLVWYGTGLVWSGPNIRWTSTGQKANSLGGLVGSNVRGAGPWTHGHSTGYRLPYLLEALLYGHVVGLGLVWFVMGTVLWPVVL